MNESPGMYDTEMRERFVKAVQRTGYPVAEVKVRMPRVGYWECSCIAPKELPMPDLCAVGETLSEALLELSDMMEDWEQEQKAKDEK